MVLDKEGNILYTKEGFLDTYAPLFGRTEVNIECDICHQHSIKILRYLKKYIGTYQEDMTAKVACNSCGIRRGRALGSDTAPGQGKGEPVAPFILNRQKQKAAWDLWV